MGALFNSPSTVSGAAWGTGQLHQENAKDLVDTADLPHSFRQNTGYKKPTINLEGSIL
jgi:hypothetical protein